MSTSEELGAGRRASRQKPWRSSSEPSASAPSEQLAHVQRVALAALVHPAAGRLLDRRAQHRLDQLGRLGLVERVELQPRHAGVLPQRPDGVRARLARPQRHDHEGGAGEHEVEHQRRRRGVEQLRVVDAEHDRAGRPRARAARSAIRRMSSSGLPRGTFVGSSAANAASGTVAALRVACTHAGGRRPGVAAATAWRARLDLPTPAAAPIDDARAGAGATQRRDARQLVVTADQRPLERLRCGGRAGGRDAGSVRSRPVTHRRHPMARARRDQSIRATT